MVLETTAIKAEIIGSVNKQSFSQAVTEVKKVGKEIDRSLQLKINLSNFKEGLREANAQLRAARKAGNKELVLEANLKIDKLKQGTKLARNELKKIRGEAVGLSGAIGKAFNNLGKSIVKSLGPVAAALGAGALARGVANLVSGFSNASAIIAKETGAVGDSLDQLQKDLKAVSGTVPQSLDQVAQAIGDINTRFKVSGTELQTLTKDFLDFSRVTGTDVASSIRTVSRLAQDFGVSVADTPLLLDKLTVASQNTGISVDQLGTTATNFGVQFRALGFGLDETIALLSKFEAEGVNVEKVTSGLSIALGRLAKEGIDDPVEAFGELIKGLKDTESVGEATRDAIELLGAKAGPDFALAVREGRFEFQDYLDLIGGAEGTLNRTAEASLTVGERLKTSLNGALAALQPLFEAIGNAIVFLLDGFQRFGTGIGIVSVALTGLGIAFGVLTGPIGLVVGGISALVSAFGFLSGATNNTSTDFSIISTRAAELTVELDKVTASLNELDQQYKDNLITQTEYNNKQAELKQASEDLIAQREEEKKKLEELNQTYFDAQEAISKNNDAINKQKADLSELKALFILGALTQEQYAEGVAEATAEIDKMTLENQKLAEVQKIQLVTQEDVNAALEQLSAANTISEFKKIQSEAINVIEGLIAVQEELIRTQQREGNFNLVSTEGLRLQNDLLDTQARLFATRSRVFGGGGDEDDDDTDTPGGGGSGAAAKAAKEEADAIAKIKKDADDAEAKRVKDLEDAQKEALDRQVKEFKTAFDAIGDSIKDKEDAIADFTKEIEKSGETIDDLTKQIDDLGKDTANDLASRFASVGDEITDAQKEITDIGTGAITAEDAARLNELRSELEKLNEEQSLIQANTTSEQRTEAVRQEGLSETEKILEAQAAELARLEALKAAEVERFVALDEARTAESFKLLELRALEEELSNRAIAQVQKEFTEKTRAAKEYESTLDSIISKSAAAAEAASGFQAASIFTGTQTVPIDQSTNTVNVDTIVIPESLTPEQTADFLLQAIKDSQKQDATPS